jgi:hypothetical protein
MNREWLGLILFSVPFLVAALMGVLPLIWEREYLILSIGAGSMATGIWLIIKDERDKWTGAEKVRFLIVPICITSLVTLLIAE